MADGCVAAALGLHQCVFFPCVPLVFRGGEPGIPTPSLVGYQANNRPLGALVQSALLVRFRRDLNTPAKTVHASGRIHNIRGKDLNVSLRELAVLTPNLLSHIPPSL